MILFSLFLNRRVTRNRGMEIIYVDILTIFTQLTGTPIRAHSRSGTRWERTLDEWSRLNYNSIIIYSR